MILKNMENYLKNCALFLSGGCPATLKTDKNQPMYPLVTALNESISKYYLDSNTTRSPFDTEQTLYLCTNQFSTSKPNMLRTYIGFGEGTTAVSESDYILENQIFSGLSLVSGQSVINNVYSMNEEKTELTRVVTVTANVKNGSTDDITISEIGFYQTFNSNMKYTLIHREVLDTPVTIGAGAIATFEFTFNFKNAIV